MYQQIDIKGISHAFSCISSHTRTHNMSIYIMIVAAVLCVIHVHKKTWPVITNVVLNMHVRIFSWTLLFQIWIVKSEDPCSEKDYKCSLSGLPSRKFLFFEHVFTGIQLQSEGSDLPCFQLCFLIFYPIWWVSKCTLKRRNSLICQVKIKIICQDMSSAFAYWKSVIFSRLFLLASNKQLIYLSNDANVFSVNLQETLARLGDQTSSKLTEVPLGGFSFM